jgi:hypothetical protein
MKKIEFKIPLSDIEQSLMRAIESNQATADRLSRLALTDSEFAHSSVKISSAQKMCAKNMQNLIESKKELEHLLNYEQLAYYLQACLDIMHGFLKCDMRPLLKDELQLESVSDWQAKGVWLKIEEEIWSKIAALGKPPKPE